MCRVLIKLLSFLLRKLEEYLDAQLKKTQARFDAAAMRPKTPKASISKVDFVGNVILLITSIGLMITSYIITSWVMTITHTLK